MAKIAIVKRNQVIIDDNYELESAIETAVEHKKNNDAVEVFILTARGVENDYVYYVNNYSSITIEPYSVFIRQYAKYSELKI